MTLLFQMANSPEDRIMMAHPWMNRLPLLRKLLKRDKVVEGFRSVLDLMRDSIEEHEQSMDVNMPRDFIDMVGFFKVHIRNIISETRIIRE